MSTSRGGARPRADRGGRAAEQLRYNTLRPRPNQAIDFDPGTDQIPRLFDEFDKFASATMSRDVRGELPPGYEATFRYSLIDPEASSGRGRPAFGRPSPTWRCSSRCPASTSSSAWNAGQSTAADRERHSSTSKAVAAPFMARRLRPRSAQLTIRHEALPPAASSWTPSQRRFLTKLAGAPRAKAGHRCLADAHIHRSDRGGRGRSARAFEAIYRAFLDRPNGPRRLAAEHFDPAVLARANEAGGLTGAVA